jgi:hypothetical protein
VSDLHERLDYAFAAVEPGAAPVEAVMMAGRKIRNRRRAGLLAGAVAVVVGAVIGVPAFTHQQALPAPAVSRSARVTVNPPGPHAPAGLIASGLIGTTPWNLSVVGANSDNCVFTGTGLSFSACDEYPGQPNAAAPISWLGEGGGTDANPSFVSFGQVWKGVVSARVELSDGTVLTLHPARVDGLRFVAFAIPAHLPVDSVTAYSATGEIATAIPFSASNGFPIFSAWVRPGQARPPRITGTFGSGTAMVVHLGPWGTCLDVGGGQHDCFPQTKEPGTFAMGSSPSVVFGAAAESVSYLTITRKDGSTLRAEPTAVGPQKFWAVPLSQSEQAGARWTAYDDKGKAVGSGSLSS